MSQQSQEKVTEEDASDVAMEDTQETEGDPPEDAGDAGDERTTEMTVSAPKPVNKDELVAISNDAKEGLVAEESDEETLSRYLKNKDVREVMIPVAKLFIEFLESTKCSECGQINKRNATKIRKVMAESAPKPVKEEELAVSGLSSDANEGSVADESVEKTIPPPLSVLQEIIMKEEEGIPTGQAYKVAAKENVTQEENRTVSENEPNATEVSSLPKSNDDAENPSVENGGASLNQEETQMERHMKKEGHAERRDMDVVLNLSLSSEPQFSFRRPERPPHTPSKKRRLHPTESSGLERLINVAFSPSETPRRSTTSMRSVGKVTPRSRGHNVNERNTDIDKESRGFPRKKSFQDMTEEEQIAVAKYHSLALSGRKIEPSPTVDAMEQPTTPFLPMMTFPVASPFLPVPRAESPVMCAFEMEISSEEEDEEDDEEEDVDNFGGFDTMEYDFATNHITYFQHDVTWPAIQHRPWCKLLTKQGVSKVDCVQFAKIKVAEIRKRRILKKHRAKVSRPEYITHRQNDPPVAVQRLADIGLYPSEDSVTNDIFEAHASDISKIEEDFAAEREIFMAKIKRRDKKIAKLSKLLSAPSLIAACQAERSQREDLEKELEDHRGKLSDAELKIKKLEDALQAAGLSISEPPVNPPQ